jgi:hypothetical protein
MKADFQKVVDRAKKALPGILPQQIGDMTIEKSEGGYNLMIQYTRGPGFNKNGEFKTLGIHFNKEEEAQDVRDFLRYREDIFNTPSDNTSYPGRDVPFIADL